MEPASRFILTGDDFVDWIGRCVHDPDRGFAVPNMRNLQSVVLLWAAAYPELSPAAEAFNACLKTYDDRTSRALCPDDIWIPIQTTGDAFAQLVADLGDVRLEIANCTGQLRRGTCSGIIGPDGVCSKSYMHG